MYLRLIDNKLALELVYQHYNNTHDETGVSLINFYAEYGAHQTYYLGGILDWLGY